MSRTILSIIALAVAVCALSLSTVVMINAWRHPVLSKEEQEARKRFFGTGDKLPPIPKGQETRPRW